MNILVSAIGGDVAQSVARCVRDLFPRATIFGSDLEDQNSGTLFVDQMLKISRADSQDYISHLLALLSENKIDIFLPINEMELINISKHLELFDPNMLVFPGKLVIEKCIDKLETNLLLQEQKLPFPWTIDAERELPTIFPCYFKGRTGSGSRNQFKVTDGEMAQFLAKRYTNGIFQEFLSDENPEITCGVYRAQNNDVHVIQLKRKLTGGSTSWAEVVDNRDITMLCEKLAHALGLRGSMNVQLRLTPHGPMVFEINPRFSSTVYLRHMLGFQDVKWAIDEKQNKKISYFSPCTGTKGLRVSTFQVLKEKV